MILFTIGFTKTSAECFFERLKDSGAQRILDVRLNNASQLSGFAKRDDLRYFADRLCNMTYRHMLELAPTKELLDKYKKKKISWDNYSEAFMDIIANRRIEELDENDLDGSCLLCSEDKPHFCHRRLVAEYLQNNKRGIEIVHL